MADASQPPSSGRDRLGAPAGDGSRDAPGAAVDRGALTDALDAFAATVTGSFTARDVLMLLARAVTEVLAVDGAGVMVAEDTSLLRFAYAHGRLRGTVTDVELLQELLQDGPCQDSHLSGRLVNIADLATEGSWPAYQQRAADVGLRAVAAIPLRARGRSWGVLDVYRSQVRRLDQAEMTAAQTLANLATSYLVVAADREGAEQARAAAEQARASAEQAQAELAHRAMHDPLTGLPVRWVLLEQAGHALARLARHPGHVGVLFVDLDGLKYVNDTYGHAAGDDLLTTCARRIRASLRPSDLLARVGGDEFVVLLEDLPPGTARSRAAAGEEAGVTAAAVAHRVLARLSAPHRVDGHVMTPSASVGLALTADPATPPATLIAHADAAMYRAKRTGRGRVETFDAAGYESDRAEATTTDRLLPALRSALGADQLELYYQPVWDVARGEGPPGGGCGGRCGGGTDVGTPRSVHGVEALLRWNRPGHGVVPAADFVEAAERTSLIADLGAWVLRAACSQLAGWDETLGDRAPRHLLVNVSAVELLDPDLPRRVGTCLAGHGLEPGRLVLEVTETAILTDHDAAATTVAALLDLGVSLAIDDFGTGYATLSRLVELPVATLKVDRSFTRDLLTRPAARAVVTAVLQLGRTLDRAVVVEGVEDEATHRALLDLGARYLQGYHLAPPLTADRVAALLAAAPHA